MFALRSSERNSTAQPIFSICSRTGDTASACRRYESLIRMKVNVHRRERNVTAIAVVTANATHRVIAVDNCSCNGGENPPNNGDAQPELICG